MNISEVSTAGKRVVERDITKSDSAESAGILAVETLAEDGMVFEAGEGRCGSLAPATCGTSFCS
jgi:hypothetical protein